MDGHRASQALGCGGEQEPGCERSPEPNLSATCPAVQTAIERRDDLLDHPDTKESASKISEQPLLAYRLLLVHPQLSVVSSDAST
jgi:hypothetical protein